MDSYVMVDGGFLRQRCRDLGLKLRAVDVPYVARQIMKSQGGEHEVYRIYYYDCPPSAQQVALPISGAIHNFADDSLYAERMLFLDQLKDCDNVWVREGVLSFQGWQLRRDCYDRGGNCIVPRLYDENFQPQFEQKEIDTLIALDIAQLAMERIVKKLYLIAGDTDFAPALRLAREKGVQVYLFTLGNKVKQELRANCDIVVTDPIQVRSTKAKEYDEDGEDGRPY